MKWYKDSVHVGLSMQYLKVKFSVVDSMQWPSVNIQYQKKMHSKSPSQFSVCEICMPDSILGVDLYDILDLTQSNS
jgi:hypothetical protein